MLLLWINFPNMGIWKNTFYLIYIKSLHFPLKAIINSYRYFQKIITLKIHLAFHRLYAADMKHEDVTHHWQARCNLDVTSAASLEVEQQAIIHKETERE